jgi:predicted P-loop ATPase
MTESVTPVGAAGPDVQLETLLTQAKANPGIILAEASVRFLADLSKTDEVSYHNALFQLRKFRAPVKELLKKVIIVHEDSDDLDYSYRGFRDWRDGWKTDRFGSPVGNDLNVYHSLHACPDLVGLVGLDIFANRTMLLRRPPYEGPSEAKFVRRQWSDIDDSNLVIWLQDQGMTYVDSSKVTRCVDVVARENAFDPVKDYLDSLRWDGTSRLDRAAVELLGAEDTIYNASVFAKFAMAAVARIYEPGCQVKSVLILEGEQDLGKSKFLAEWFGRRWFTDNLPDMHTKDARAQLLGSWAIEISELSALSRSAVEAVKAFLSAQTDKFRPSYGRHTIELPRRCVFAGSSNSSNWNRDSTGGSRFWPIEVHAIDIEKLRETRDQLWAEAVARYKAGEEWHIKDAAVLAVVREQQAERRDRSVWFDDVAHWLNHNKPDHVTATKILEEVIRLELRDMDQRAKNQVADILRELGWKPKTVRLPEHGPRKVYIAPS